MDRQDISLSHLVVDKNQPRKIFDDTAMQSLEDSIKFNGVDIPLIIRQNFGEKTFTIVDGERRFRAATSLKLKTLPCLIEDTDKADEIVIFEKQLRIDFQKEKLSSDELDEAIFKYWEMLNNLPEEEVSHLIPKSGDWKIPYMSRNTGMSYTRIDMALKRKDFKEKNKDFHERVKNIIEKSNDPSKEKRYNRIIEETARIPKLKDDDETRKKIVDRYVKENIDSDNTALRKKLDRISKIEKPTNKEINEILGVDLLGTKKDSDGIKEFKRIMSNMRDSLCEIRDFKEFFGVKEVPKDLIGEFKSLLKEISSEF
jgi:ParB/RepB/Spo0J family partition protein